MRNRALVAAVFALTAGGSMLASGLGGGTRLAWADDPIAWRVTALEKKVEEHGGKPADVLLPDLKETVALLQENAGGGKDEKIRDRCLRLLGNFARGKEESVVRAAILALGDTGDPAAAKHFRCFLRPVTDDKVPVPTTLDLSLDAAKKIPEDTLVEPLLSIVDDSKNLKVAAKAMDVLSAYGGLKRSRERILESLTKSVEKSRTGMRQVGGLSNHVNPDGGVGNTTGTNGGDRWGALAPILPKVLDEMTGQHHPSAAEWIKLVQDSRGRLGALFKDKDNP